MATKKSKPLKVALTRTGFTKLAYKYALVFGKASKSVQYVQRNGKRYTLAQAEKLAREEYVAAKSTSANIRADAVKTINKLVSNADVSSSPLFNDNSSYRLQSNLERNIYLHHYQHDYFQALTTSAQYDFILRISGHQQTQAIWKYKNTKAYDRVTKTIAGILHAKESGIAKGLWCSSEDGKFIADWLLARNIDKAQWAVVYGSEVIN